MDYYALFHKIHCILRDGEIGLTGLNALNEINNMIYIIFNYNSLKLEYKFSNIYNNCVHKYITEKQKLIQNNYLEKILEIYCDTLESFYNDPNTKKYIFSD